MNTVNTANTANMEIIKTMTDTHFIFTLYDKNKNVLKVWTYNRNFKV
jgi:hypothetical protein